MWKVRQIITLLLVWVLLIVTLFCAHNIGHIPDPPHRTEREFLQLTNSSKETYHQTPPGESGPETMSQRNHNEDESEIGRRMKERRQRVQAVCKKYQPYNNVVNTLIYRDFFFHNYNLTVCLIAKSGSSTWRKHMRLVNGGPPDNLPMEKDENRMKMMQLQRNDLIAKVNSMTNIITVRHPLTRLVSCFRQKYHDGNLLAKYRPKYEKNKLKKVAAATWQHLVYQFWVPVLYSNNMLPPGLHHRLGLQEPINPKIMYDTEVYVKLRDILQPRFSFTHFLRHVVATYEAKIPDAHWKDYVSECSPCFFDYKYVTKLETMTQDLEYVFKELGLPSHPDFAFNRVRSSLKDVTSDYEYYRKVPMKIRKKIYDIFQLDFEMYDYKLPPWFLVGA